MNGSLRVVQACVTAAGAIAAIVTATASACADPVDFARDIRPLLTSHCTACHGGVKKAGGISFIAQETATAEGDSGQRPIVPGDGEASELLRRVASTDEAERMPPPDHGRQLTPAEIDLLRRWIAEGAPWRAHWSFEPPVDPPAPTVKDAAWPRVPLDAFVAARLDAEGLEPSRPASPAEWLRRVSLDLTGLPPTAADYEIFVADGGCGPDVAADRTARVKQVDRLLASPHFGERWASMWLDLARYADTLGFEKDPDRTIWPWRDWVIRAVNDDMSFDRFTVRQLAGDLLPDATLDDYLATAFHRNTQSNDEGGTDDEEFRMAAVIDRVNTTWTAWQGTTFGCVQCHAHPYDAFQHDDYYRFLAYFNETQDRDLTDDFPRLPIPGDPQGRELLPKLLRSVEAKRRQLTADGAALAEADAWKPVAVAHAAATMGTLMPVGDGWVKSGGTLPIGVRYDLDIDLPPGTTALRIDLALDSGGSEAAPPERGAVLSHVTLDLPPPPATTAAAAPPAAPDQASAEPPPPPEPPKPVPVAIAEVFADALDGPFDPASTLHPDDAGFGGYPTLDRPRWCVFALADPAAVAAGGRVRLAITQSARANASFQGCPLRSFRITASTDSQWTNLLRDEPRRRRRDDLAADREALAKIGGPSVPVLREVDPDLRRWTHIFVRGNRMDCGAAVEPGIPVAVAPPATMPTDRLGMAEWLVGDTNPLAARVLANRLWAEMFGTGIVESLEDFGSSGQRPSHPDLLDHLAVRLKRDHRWSVKAFLREIALSATYGQTAAASPALVARDPRNRLLARGPRSRLTAEMVRDQALVWSGLFAPALYGPPVFPLQPEGIWKSVYNGGVWQPSQGPDRFRRSIYTFVKRTAGYPALLAFDAPSRDLCSPRRFPTNTPLQALVTLNDPMFTELAAGVASRMRAAGPTTRERIAFGCRLLTLDAPPAAMIDALEGLHATALEEFTKPADTPAADVDLAALGIVATAILNFDQALAR
jgi:hypothetical protein